MALLKVPAYEFPLVRGTGKVLLAEASDVTAGGTRPLVFALDKPASRYGLNVVSPKTGKRAVFVLVKRHLDEDGDVRWWDLVPSPETLKHQPALAGFTLRIFND